MGDMLSDLEKMFSNIDVDDADALFGTEKPADKAATAAKEQVEKSDQDYEREALFEKKYECPICDSQFTQKSIRMGATRLISTDTDLRRKFKYFDPSKYDILACPKCGYAALGQQSFNSVSSLQRKMLKEQIQANFKGMPEMGELMSYDDALARYKLALYTSVVKKSKNSERAYLCLKMAWLYRGKKEDMDPAEENYQEKQKKCEEEEKGYLQKAYTGFGAAVQNEMFPICGMDENTFNYLYAELARRSGDIDMAKRMVGTILISKSATPALKEKARALKELLVG